MRRLLQRVVTWLLDDSEFVVNYPCHRCSVPVRVADGRTGMRLTYEYVVHSDAEPCPNAVERWCMNCNAWRLTDIGLRCESCLGTVHPGMRPVGRLVGGATVRRG